MVCFSGEQIMSGAFYDQVRVSFSQLKMQTRFLDRKIADGLEPRVRKFLMRVGGAIRITGRRLLRKARKVRRSELSTIERSNYDTAKKLYESGQSQEKPALPDKTADHGKPPMLHVAWDAGTSPLKHRLWFALNERADAVLIGPAAIGRNRTAVKGGGISTLRELERQHPFMEPAYKAIEPRIPGYLAGALG